MNFYELAEKIIQQTNQPLSPNEIWEKAVESGLDKQLNTKGKTPWATLGARLYLDVRDNPNTNFDTVGKNPKRFGLKNITLNPKNQSRYFKLTRILFSSCFKFELGERRLFGNAEIR